MVSEDRRAHCFYHFKLTKEFADYCAFFEGEELYRFCRLPMGLSISPYVVSKVFDEVKKTLRREYGIVVTSFIDDFVIYGKDVREAQKHLELVVELLARWGFVLHERKTVPASTALEVLGVWYDFSAKTVSVSESYRGLGRSCWLCY